MSGPHPAPDRPRATPRPRQESATDVVRWAAFSCVLVPVVLLWYGSSLAGATGTALGLAAVTAVCRLLLHRSERCAARAAGGEHGASGAQGELRDGTDVAPPGESRGRRADLGHPAHGTSPAPGPDGARQGGGDGAEEEERTVPQQGQRGRTGAGVRRDRRHTGGSTPVV
ncbi:hypothetical protein [Streptomyces sp. ACT015]|uniref:hypothetical protein n=1 Tax=Streptomyces sp. ACT015 TaxID=3134807 RepID=UPI003D17BAEE